MSALRRVLAQEWLSLDGFAAGPGGEADIFAAVSPEADSASQQWNQRLLGSVDEVLLGRATYEMFAAYWPTAKEPVAAQVNMVRRTVFSRSLTAAPWGDFAPAAVESDPISYVRGRRTSGTILVWGSLSIVQALHSAGELDELDLFIAPVVLGEGRRLPAGHHSRLQLVHAEQWDGSMHLRYLLDRR